MKITKDGYVLTEKEINSIEIIEVEKKGKLVKVYLIRSRSREGMVIPTKTELIELIKKKTKMMDLLKHYNCSTTFLRKYLNKYFGTAQFNSIKFSIEQSENKIN